LAKQNAVADRIAPIAVVLVMARYDAARSVRLLRWPLRLSSKPGGRDRTKEVASAIPSIAF
jgi:hypothetical protein